MQFKFSENAVAFVVGFLVPYISLTVGMMLTSNALYQRSMTWTAGVLMLTLSYIFIDIKKDNKIDKTTYLVGFVVGLITVAVVWNIWYQLLIATGYN